MEGPENKRVRMVAETPTSDFVASISRLSRAEVRAARRYGFVEAKIRRRLPRKLSQHLNLDKNLEERLAAFIKVSVVALGHVFAVVTQRAEERKTREDLELFLSDVEDVLRRRAARTWNEAAQPLTPGQVSGVLAGRAQSELTFDAGTASGSEAVFRLFGEAFVALLEYMKSVYPDTDEGERHFAAVLRSVFSLRLMRRWQQATLALLGVVGALGAAAALPQVEAAARKHGWDGTAQLLARSKETALNAKSAVRDTSATIGRKALERMRSFARSTAQAVLDSIPHSILPPLDEKQDVHRAASKIARSEERKLETAVGTPPPPRVGGSFI